MEATITIRENGKFVEKKISRTMRDDFEKYLMGQTKIKFVAKIRKKTQYEVTRVFNALFQEKLHNNQQ